MGTPGGTIPIQSTAGAIAVKNEKGQFSMQKVKVNRYVSGKRPDYAGRSSSDEDSENEEFVIPNRFKHEEEEAETIPQPVERIDLTEYEKNDPRLRRLQQVNESRRRRVEDPEILSDSSSEDERPGRHYESDSEKEEENIDDEEIERRRAYLRQRALEKREEEELLTKEEEKDSGSEEAESEYEEYTDSEEEEARPRLKPVFVRRRDRVTLKEREIMEEKEKELMAEDQKKNEERRKDTLKIVEEVISREKGSSAKADEDATAHMPQLGDVDTDDEDVETEYEAWKIRELKRVKRDREEREAYDKEKMEIERLRNLTEEERRLEMKLKPKTIINKPAKGKYKFLQKYYHRGAFYLDKEDDVLKRDYSAPTLEDHHDKTILPKVMQVKNFGRSGRTKYTHLVDQDTTSFDSPWVSETSQNLKFHATQAGGVRQVFERPSVKKRKTHMGDEG